jgi:hypothetical protein
MSDTATFELQLETATAGDERGLEQLTSALSDELRQVRGARVERVRVEAPEQTKGLDAATIGSLLVSLTSAGGALTALVGVLSGWIRRDRGRRITVKIGDRSIELSDATLDQEQQLIDAFVKAGQAEP